MLQTLKPVVSKYRPKIISIKFTKRTRRKLASIELSFLELFEKIYSLLTLSFIRSFIDNFFMLRRFELNKIFEKKIKIDRKAEKWSKQNKWFGKDMPMTYTAFDIHKKLVDEEGVNPKSEKYYEELDKRIYVEFPDKIKKYYSTNN